MLSSWVAVPEPNFINFKLPTLSFSGHLLLRRYHVASLKFSYKGTYRLTWPPLPLKIFSIVGKSGK